MSAVTRMSTAATVSSTGSTPSLLESSFTSLRSRIVMDGMGLPKAFRHGSYPSIGERTAAIEAAVFVRRSLQPLATAEEAAKAVRMLAGGLKVASGVDGEGLAEAYLFVLEGVKAMALKAAVRNLLTGRAPTGFSRTFLPSAPELLAYCEQLERDALALAISTEQLLVLPEEPPAPEPMSEAECQAMREKIAKLGKPRAIAGGAA